MPEQLTFKNTLMIFVSIASYKDKDLPNTIASLFENADQPDKIRVGVLNQTDDRQDSVYPNVEMLYVAPYSSKGVCWARAILQSMIRDEKYYLQIDAHMRFAKGWDTKMIQLLEMANSKKPILSYYPPGFEDNWAGEYVVKNVVRGVGSGAVSSINKILNAEEEAVRNGAGYPIPSHTSAAGFLFAPVEFVHEVPIDPKLFWNYEETDITLRAYTHGWDFFASPEPIIWHRYNTTGKMIHMEESNVWLPLENESNEHAPKKYFDMAYQYPQKYKLGTKRKVEQFEILNNIDIQAKTAIEGVEKKMLVVVPYRDRDEHLNEYLERVPKYLKDLSCDILLCELEPGCEWNAGATVNSAINFINKANYEFIYISHVDVYPYQGWEWPQPGTFISDLGDVGSCLMRLKDFLSVGGCGNNFWGWGGEDDDLYNKLQSKGLTRVKSNVLFDTKHQTHNRPFNGLNYTNNLREFYKPLDYSSIFRINKVAEVSGPVKLADNLYKQFVRLDGIKAPNKKAILGYVQGVTDFSIVAPWAKSAVYYGTDYDVWMIVTDDSLTHELTNFGLKVYKYTPKDDYLFTDRFNAFKELLAEHPYDEVLHVDVTDAYFQSNPFESVSGDLVVVSEEINIENCQWNLSMLANLYSTSYTGKEVICSGVIYGKRLPFIDLCDKIILEALAPNTKAIRGSDQPIVIKLIYANEVQATVLDSSSAFAVHLHHQLSGNVDIAEIERMTVSNKEGKKFAIVHQYNRSPELYSNIINYFHKFFSIDQVR